MTSIVVTKLGKRYKFYPRRWGRLAEWLSGGQLRPYRPNWVLRGVSFEVAAGEAVGLVGQNGAGKSTLLKVLAGTTPPTEGRFEIAGRVAALLELGMGFHPEFTGRQNALVGMQLLGLQPEEIDRSLHEVWEFSELG